MPWESPCGPTLRVYSAAKPSRCVYRPTMVRTPPVEGAIVGPVSRILPSPTTIRRPWRLVGAQHHRTTEVSMQSPHVSAYSGLPLQPLSLSRSLRCVPVAGTASRLRDGRRA